ncbi:hypothetical protein OIU84_010840 [Salix udensis]|uniref:Glyoxal oxidase N-terminal domain-containing protein n=1 Tax=Salix udensis TaxID=889485 RepID=A0AAD6JLM3_9ROSI|nr:hypothetical protein OIU84_010840 [Salix udensis]
MKRKKILPTDDVLVINGAQAGTQGFEMASNPCLYPLLYRPDKPIGLRFMTLNPGTVPRLYRSTTNLLLDGRVMGAGSNPHHIYNFKAEFPTRLLIEAFSPEYLSPDQTNIRPVIEEIPDTICFRQAFNVLVSVTRPVVGLVEVNFASTLHGKTYVNFYLHQEFNPEVKSRHGQCETQVVATVSNSGEVSVSDSAHTYPRTKEMVELQEI